MKLSRNTPVRAEGGLAILIIVAALVLGALWFLFSSRNDGQRNARAFADDVVQHIAVNYDEKYLHVHLSPEGQTKYLQSWRDRMLQNLRSFGPVKQPIPVTGDVRFSSVLFRTGRDVPRRAGLSDDDGISGADHYPRDDRLAGGRNESGLESSAGAESIPNGRVGSQSHAFTNTGAEAAPEGERVAATGRRCYSE